MRRLRCTRRLVPLDCVDEYFAGWAAARTAVERAGGRAWLFRAEGHDDQFLEFVEWAEPSAPLEDATVLASLAGLTEIAATSHSDGWEEAG